MVEFIALLALEVKDKTKQNKTYPEKKRNPPNSSDFVFKCLNIYWYEVQKKKRQRKKETMCWLFQ